MSKSLKWTLTALTVVVVTALLLVASLPVAVIAEEQGVVQTDSTNSEIDTFVKELSELNASGDKAGARNYITDKFREALGESDDTADSKVKHIYCSSTSYVNIEAQIQGADSTKQIIVGAHYDSVGAGADDNVCGVVALYLTMRTLAQQQSNLPYTVTFVAFDGEEEGLIGSDEYVKNIKDKSNVLVMFNIDSIGTGDNLYLMCENKHTDLANLILTKSQDITEKSYAKGTYALMDQYGYGYYEFVQGSDHTSFRLQGIPVAFFFSGTYDADIWGFSQSSDTDRQVWNTSRDTYDNLAKSGVDYVSRIQTVSNAIAQTILDDEFTAVAGNARNQLVNLNFWYNGLWPSLAVLVILLILVIFTVLYSRKLQKKAILGTADVKTHKIFEKPDAEDIFTFKDQAPKGDGSNVDDIFTFKK